MSNEAMRRPRAPDCFDKFSHYTIGMSPAVWAGFNMERVTMGLTYGNEPQFTAWTHSENGKVTHRRLHRIEVQDRTGRLHRIYGEKLPEAIHTFSGQSFKGAHLATILLRPESIPAPKAAPPSVDYWPRYRDVVNMFIGIMIVVTLRFIVGVLATL